MKKLEKTVNGHVYKLIPASICEVGLVCDDKGIRTWWASDFDGELPDINHPEVQRCISINEQYLQR